MQLPLAHRRLLVTAGPTWVTVDRVRVLTPTFTGETGLVLSSQLAGRLIRVPG